ncbi:hypothetical protein GCM10027298_35820 [Epidermidibacterium keratini]
MHTFDGRRTPTVPDKGACASRRRGQEQSVTYPGETDSHQIQGATNEDSWTFRSLLLLRGGVTIRDR